MKPEILNRIFNTNALREREKFRQFSDRCTLRRESRINLSPPFIHFRDGYFSSRYENKSDRKVFFVTSSGLCNLNCSYCITGRPRIHSSLGLEDFTFLFDYFGDNIYFIFSGLGDFFCGYSADELLLKFLLGHNVNIFLDINGVDIKELGDPDLPGKEKIDMINVSYHYNTMKNQRLLDRWAESVRKIQANRYKYDIKMVAAPAERDIWNEAVLFYKKEIQPITRQKLCIVPDGLTDLASQCEGLNQLAAKFQEAVFFSGRGAMYKERPDDAASDHSCPAGSRYFRLLHTGDIIPCELFYPQPLGNLKQKTLSVFRKDVACSYTGFCDCQWATNPGTRLLNERGKPYSWKKG
jgi:hypothetical protein